MSARIVGKSAFYLTSIVAFCVIVPGFEIYARVHVSGEGLEYARAQTFHYLAVQPIATVFRLVPFVTLAWISASLLRLSLTAAVLLFVVYLVLFGLMQYHGEITSQVCLGQRRWTCAGLATGLVPVKSLSLLFIALLVRVIWGRSRSRLEPDSGKKDYSASNPAYLDKPW